MQLVECGPEGSAAVRVVDAVVDPDWNADPVVGATTQDEDAAKALRRINALQH